MASGSKGRQQQIDAANAAAQAAQAAANQSITHATAPDPLEQRRRDYVTRVLDWREGKNGPTSVSAFPDQTGMALFNNARTVHDAGRLGRGYGTLSDGANPNFSAALDQENEMTRQQAAAGGLENFINGQLAASDAETGNLWSAGDARNMGIAQLRQGAADNAHNRYLQLLMQPRPPSFLSQLAGGLLGNVGAAFLGGGGGGGGGGGAGNLASGIMSGMALGL